ncbi:MULTISPECIES: glycosyltransferase [Microbacterium]|uniref:glycosyltransferase n=1 Tax=Microbacterium TaxID=33882 RepID=UPI00217E107B|nr:MULTISPECIES: glycosyltransferase [Microbacterium]UWF77895.1 glycosyltransferase [Microbacterium neungamense]WCM56072.1 glycosyltransferase [Microbacterium sp. EF45047]
MADLIVMSLERWDDVWRRNQYLVAGLLDTDPDLRVLFVEPADDPVHALRSRKRPEFGQRLRRSRDRLWTFRPVKALPRRLDPRADERLARSVIRTARTLGMRHPALWINDPGAVAVARITGWPTLYDMTDDWLAADRPAAERARIASAEEWLLAHARTVVACSPELVRRKRAGRADIRLVRNAVDATRYTTPLPRPADLPDEPVAVYVGTLHRDRLDVDLCIRTAERLRRRARLVLVGPDLLPERDAQALTDAGVLLLGGRPHETVPAYLQHADVLVVPHVVSEFTDSLDPIKLYEYQAVGRPVVSTPVAGFRDAAGVTVASGAAFADAVAHGVPSATAFPAGANPDAADWSARVIEFRAALPLS